MLRFLGFLLFIAAAGGAFYAGLKYQTMRSSSIQPVPIVESSSTSDAARAAARAEVDSDPRKWLEDNKEAIAQAADSKNAEFLYLYGRALMLTGEHQKAIQAFDQALNNLRVESKGKLPLDIELRLASASAALKSKTKAPPQDAFAAEQKAMRTLDELLNLKSEAR